MFLEKHGDQLFVLLLAQGGLLTKQENNRGVILYSVFVDHYSHSLVFSKRLESMCQMTFTVNEVVPLNYADRDSHHCKISVNFPSILQKQNGNDNIQPGNVHT